MTGPHLKQRFDAICSDLLVRWVASVQRRAATVALGGTLASLLFALYAVLNLGVDSNNSAHITKTLPGRVDYEEYIRHFPNLEEALLVVVDGDTPELAREAALALTDRLEADREHFRSAHAPGLDPFFESHGLLYREVDELYLLADQISRIQPLLVAMDREPNLARFSELLQLGLESSRDAQAAQAEWTSLLERIDSAVVQVYAEYPVAVSWEDVFLRGSSIEAVRRWVIVTEPVLDYGSLLAAQAPMDAVRRAADELDLDVEHGVRVRITGNPALNLEEMLQVIQNVGLGGIASFLIVAVLVWRALRAPRLVLASLGTLVAGLFWTAAFGAAAVGDINLASAAFGVLFIGLAVDFTLHLGLHYADRLQRGLDPERAMQEALREIGPSLVLCTATTLIGFWSFVPTDNLGVAELGLIAGAGMLINFGLTLTLFPALLASWLRLDPQSLRGATLRFRGQGSHWLGERARWVLAAAAIAGLGAAALAPRAEIEANVLELRDPSTESMQAFHDLLADPERNSAWHLDALAPDLAAAEALAARLRKLDTVSRAITLADFVPADQDEKLAILGDVAFLLYRSGSAAPAPPAISGEEQIAALRKLRDFLERSALDSQAGPIGAGMRRLRDSLDGFLAEVAQRGDSAAALARLERVLLSGLSAQIDRLRAATSIGPVALADLPAELVRRMQAPDGIARVQIFPSEVLKDEATFRRFAESVQRVAPRATGLVVNLLVFADTTRDSFYQAMLVASLLILALLFGLWQRVRPTLLVMAPLLLSSLLTVGAMVLLGIEFNFANVIVIPLMLGIGVDSGIHLVHRAENPESPGEQLMQSPTARAVFFSAATTLVSFGSLAFTSHRGMASLGIVLSIGMAFALISNLIVLPALLRVFALGRANESD